MQAVSNKTLYFAREFNSAGEPAEKFTMYPDKPIAVPDWVQNETVFQLGIKPHLDFERVLIPATIIVLDTDEGKKAYASNKGATPPPDNDKPENRGK